MMKRIQDGQIGEIVGGPVLLEPGRPVGEAARAQHDARSSGSAATGSTSPGPRATTSSSSTCTTSTSSNWAMGAMPKNVDGHGRAAGARRRPSTATSSTTSPSSSSIRTACA
ncbi:MAG: hypothetical protein MZV64_42905 [Ignavibacteriales bacterium]|nr:hypothetical protein [Ignavibacteriales bacterium]